MQLAVNLIFTERFKLPFFGIDKTFAETIKETVPLHAEWHSTLPFGLSFDVTEDGTTVHADLNEAGFIKLVDIPVKLGETRQVNLNPFPGVHINGTLALTADPAPVTAADTASIA